MFTGTRVPVDPLMGYLLDGNTLDEFLDDFPTIKREAAICGWNTPENQCCTRRLLENFLC